MARTSNDNFLMDSFDRDSTVCCYNASTTSNWNKPVVDVMSYNGVTDEIDALKRKINEIDDTTRQALREFCELK
jgi:hypothetical protein